MTSTIQINPLDITSCAQGERGTILTMKRFGGTQVVIVPDCLEDVARRLKAVRGLFPGLVSFELVEGAEADTKHQ